MPFARPTLSQLRQQTAADVNAALPGVDALLRFSNLGIIADVLAALASGQYGYLDWIARQMVPFTATGEYLEGWAALKRIIRKPATAASGSVAFPAAPGSTVLAGTSVMRSDGVAYVSTMDATAAGTSVAVPVSASSPGATGNAASGTSFTLGVGISGVSPTGTAIAVVTGGADVEDDDGLRGRMLAAYATPPQGGTITDYPGWALEVPGVTRAWLQIAPAGPGTLGVYFMMDEANAAQGGFPQGSDGCSQYETRDTAAAGDQLAVADAIFPRQPATALLYAFAPAANPLSLTVSGLSGASAATRTAITAAVTAALVIDAVPGGITNASAVEAAIASVPNTDGYVLTNIAAGRGSVALNGIGNITSAAGALPTLAQIIYV